jgi:glutathione S-transferase
MAKLYFTPTSCGAASFIAARKAGLIGSKVHPFIVDIGKHVVASGSEKGQDFYKINPKGNVPCVVLDDGTVLNENAATL